MALPETYQNDTTMSPPSSINMTRSPTLTVLSSQTVQAYSTTITHQHNHLYNSASQSPMQGNCWLDAKRFVVFLKASHKELTGLRQASFVEIRRIVELLVGWFIDEEAEKAGSLSTTWSIPPTVSPAHPTARRRAWYRCRWHWAQQSQSRRLSEASPSCWRAALP